MITLSNNKKQGYLGTRGIPQPETIGDDDMRELDTIAKQELKNGMASMYEDMVEALVTEYTTYGDDKDTLHGIAMLVREYSAELIDDYMNYFESLNV